MHAEDREHESRALIVDDHPIITDALASALLSLRVFDAIDKESSMTAAIARLESADEYNLVLLDLHLSDADGPETLTGLREHFPEVPLVIFSADETVATVTAAFEQGVQGYIPKSTSMPVVLSAIRTVLSGGIHIPPQAMGMLGYTSRTAAARGGEPASALPSLSPRQRQVLHYLLQGLPNKTIARRLEMADGTVKSHLNGIYRMFAVNSRAQLILKARHNGLV
jgi:DNA-binding NarL/FixJ family response regulator